MRLRSEVRELRNFKRFAEERFLEHGLSTLTSRLKDYPEKYQAMRGLGTKIKFDEEVQRYTVQAHDERFAIMTKPFNARRTYLYTVTDIKRKVRGPTSYIFGCTDVDNTTGADIVLAELQRGECTVTYRYDLPLTDDEISQLERL